jgi:DNA-directed RNA polymerase specialized sigma subunit
MYMTAYVSHKDSELIQLLRQGEEGAFTEIYNRYWKVLFNVARKTRFDLNAGKKFNIADSSTEQWQDFNELNDRISRLVANLPDKCRLVYQLKKEEGYSQREIAARLRISERAVEANISWALKALRVSIRSFFPSAYNLFLPLYRDAFCLLANE